VQINRIRTRLALSVVTLVPLSGCWVARPEAHPVVSFEAAPPSITAPPTSIGADQVNIDSFAFAPLTLTVAVGTTVTWMNRDDEPHTIRASDGSFRSPGMWTGVTFSHTFTTAGTFDYSCATHPMMHGVVVVKP
jgi:plastocyanin